MSDGLLDPARCPPSWQKNKCSMVKDSGIYRCLRGCRANPYETDRFDRYVSAGGLEYCPDPAQGIRKVLFDSCSRNPVAMRSENDIEFRLVNTI